MKTSIEGNFKEAAEVLDEFVSDPANILAIESAASLLVDAVQKGHKIISCGNGGSMTDAMHFTEELTGKFRDRRRPIPAISISDPSHLTCVANDFGFESVFSRFIEGLGQPGDVLVAISTSGNSMNVIKAIEAAREKGMMVLGLTGHNGGLMAGMVDQEIRVRGRKHSDRIQEVHVKILHILVLLIEEAIQ
jgi:D-sedoheptulose 7-phosphate isomerase